MTDPTANPLELQNRLWGLLNGLWVTRAIGAFTKLGVAEAMSEILMPVEQISAQTGLLAARLSRLLRALATVDLVKEGDAGQFALTPLGALLRQDSPQSLRTMALLSDDYWAEVWGRLDDGLRSDAKSAFEMAKGEPLFPWIGKRPEESRRFHDFIAEATRLECPGVVQAYDFSGARHVVDVAGGAGSLLKAVMEANPHLEGTLFDLPAGIESAQTARDGALVRAQLVAGDVFESVPTGGDIYLLRHVLNDFNDADSLRILANVRQAMEPCAKLLVLENPITPHPRSDHVKWVDLHMMLMFGGQNRTLQDYERLFGETGLRLERVIYTDHPLLAVMEAAPV